MISAWRPSALAFLTAFVTLFVQVLVHRIISAKLLNNYAFLVISLTMLGFAFSGVVLSRQRRWFLERLDATVATAAALFALSLLLTSVAFYRVDLPLYMAGSRGEFVTDFLRTIPIAVLFALPFAFCGLILGA